MSDKIFYDMFITFNDDKTEAYINIRPNSKVDKENLKDSVVKGFNQIKSSLKVSGIVNGILSDREILEQLKDYCLLPENKRKNTIFPIVVAKGKLPVDGEDSELIEHVKLKKELRGKIDERTGNIDHRNLGFSERIIPQGKLIVTLKKPTKGIPGKNVLGELIEPKPGQWLHQVKFDKNSIELEEDEKEIRYKAKKEGFLYKDNKKGYFVDEKVLTKAVDFKIGNIEGDEIEDSTVVVEGTSDVFEDSVKADFKVKAKKIKIKGNVGIGAEIIGENIEIDGVIDKNALVVGEHLKLNKSFGAKIEGKRIILKELSHSKAVGDIIISTNTLSSEIIGREVLILNESRGSKIKAEKFIFVNSCCGSIKQEFVINPISLPDTEKILESYKKRINTLTKEIELLEDKCKSCNAKYSQLKEKIENILNKYFKYVPEKIEQQKEALRKIFKKGDYEYVKQKFNIEFDIGDIYTIENYAEISKKFEGVTSKLDKLKEEKKSLQNKINKMLKIDLYSAIIIKSIKDCMVVVKFRDIEHRITEQINSPIIVRLENNRVKIEKIDKETKKYLLNLFENIITGDAFKVIKKVL